ncbi:MAG TPA: peptidoglycan-binding protein [Acidimicrobiales bacterium]|nr:peptidoglycan-binding protein [Acidimicrobiales bacterium]
MRRRLLLAASLLGAVAIGAIGAVDLARPGSPAPPPSAGPVTTALVERTDLTASTLLSGTLAYAGALTVSAPSGTTAADLATAGAAVSTAQSKVAADRAVLSEQRALVRESPDLASSAAAVTGDEAQLAADRGLLARDEGLGCPAASSGTVSSGAGAPASPAPSSGGSRVAADLPSATAPAASTSGATLTTADAATLAGTVDPGGATTTYSFSYGTTAALGASTPTASLPSGTAPVDVTATLTGLSAATTYLVELTASNALGSSTGLEVTFTTAASSCVAEGQVVNGDLATLAAARATAATARTTATASVSQAAGQLQGDEGALSAAEGALAALRGDAASPGSVATALPPVNATITRGGTVYGLGGHAVALFYGSVVLSRALYAGVADGPDVAELNANLAALGYAAGAGGHFSRATEAALRAFEGAHGLAVTGELRLGDVVVAPGALRVGALSVSLGAAVQPGAAILEATSTSRVATVLIDPANAPAISVGEGVSIVLNPSDRTPGTVAAIGPAPPAATSGGSPGATTAITVAPTAPAATGSAVGVPVQVAFTTDAARGVLAAPVSALLALAEGGYGVEVVEPSGARRLVGVQTGLYAGSLVQLAGPGIAAGTRVVVAQ